MAVSMSESSPYFTHVTGTLAGLQYTAENYNNFEYDLYKWNGSSWTFQETEIEYPFDHYGSYSVAHTFTYLEPNCAYRVIGWVRYGTTGGPYGNGWYDFVSGTYTTTPAITETTFSNVSTQKTTIQFDYTNTAGATNLYVWNTVEWIGIASSGLPYSTQGITNGARITLTNLIPNTAYYFRTKITIEGYDSWSPFASPYYNTYTTQAWPTISTGVSVASRFEGGYNLSWGDNGYEGNGFDYCLLYDNTYTYRFTDNVSQAFTPGDYGVSHSFKVCVGYYGYPPSGVYQWWADTAHYTSSNSHYTAPKRPGTVTLNSTTTKSFSLTASNMTNNYSAVEWRWRVYESGSGFSSSIDYGGGLNKVIDNLVHNTQYEIQCYAYHGASGLYSVDSRDRFPTTTLLTVGSPANVSVSQPGTSHTVDVFYSWGSNATGMDIRWGTDQSNWTDYNNQQNNLYPSANYNIDTTTYGNKYFQVRSRRTDGYNTVYSSYANASPYPINLVQTPTYNVKAYIGGSWVYKPLKVYLNGSWVIKNVKRFDGNSWI